MTPGDVALLIVALVCLLTSAMFSAAETALFASSRTRLARLEKDGNRRARRVNRLLAQRERLMGTIIFGNTAMNMAAGVLSTAVLMNELGSAGLVYGVILLPPIVVVLARLLPKSIAIGSPDRTALLLSGPMSFAVTVLAPVLQAIDMTLRRLLNAFGLHIDDKRPVLSAHDDNRAPDSAHPETEVEKADRQMLGGLLELRELTVGDVMIHRTEMISVDAGEPIAEVVKAILDAPVTRVPVWRDKPENIVGVVHAKDLLRALQAAEGEVDRIDIVTIARTPWFVPDIRPLDEQMRAFRRRKTPFALVVDEYGEVMGVVTLEDILEEIVGDITDEHDIELPGVRRHHTDGAITVDGGVPIRDLNRALGWSLPDDEATTIAGLVIHEAQSIPDAGQTFTFHGFRFRVLRRERNRIVALRVTPLSRMLPVEAA